MSTAAGGDGTASNAQVSITGPTDRTSLEDEEKAARAALENKVKEAEEQLAAAKEALKQAK